MSLLTIVSKTCGRLSIAIPTQIVGNTDDQIIQLLELANEEGEDLAARFQWSGLVAEATHQTLAIQNQGAITTIASGYDYLLPETIWNRTTNRKIHPLTSQDWQSVQSNQIAGPYTYMHIRGGRLLFFPVPTAGQTVAFEYYTKNWCQSSGGTGQSAWAADTDIGVLDEQIMRMGLIWRWKQKKGLDYAEDFRMYEARVANAIAKDGAVKQLRMGGANRIRFIDNRNVKEGSW